MTATIQLGHAETRRGIVVSIPGAQAFNLEQIIRGAAQIGAGFEAESRRVTDPGWWAALVCASALHHRFAPSVQRIHKLSTSVHAQVEVARGAMLDLHPIWPTFLIDSSHMVDIRPESILEAGPSDDDLRRYAEQISITASPQDLRRSFDLGVLEWDIDIWPDGRWKLRAAI